jgi:hypothetical protein
VEKEGLQNDRTASADNACDLTDASPELPSSGSGEAPLAVRSGNHPKRPVLRAAFIDVDADSDEVREQLIWWLNEVLALLHGPNAQVRVCDA